MRLIDRDELKKAMDGYWGRCQRIRKPRNGETAVFLDVRATVEKQPTIDAVPARHGKWISNSPVTMRCNQCTYVASDWIVHEFHYCPNCGARMDEE